MFDNRKIKCLSKEMRGGLAGLGLCTIKYEILRSPPSLCLLYQPDTIGIKLNQLMPV
jgi:hypothetical protein